MATLRVLFIGDVVGAPGRSMFQKHIDRLRTEYKADAVVVNGENSSAKGRGITSRIVKFFKHNGANVITTGNHIWANKEIYSYLNEDHALLRPANFPSGAPGVGYTTFLCGNTIVGVINLQGRIFMRENVDCPFRAADTILTFLKTKTNVIFVDFHAEATSEKLGLAYYLEGKISGFVGTHTHIQTADARILPGGTAYISDLGMVGSQNSMLGMTKEPIIKSFLTQMPAKFSVDHSLPVVMCGVCIQVDTNTGKAIHIDRIQIIDEELQINENED